MAMKQEVQKINSNNTDWYQWGLNTQILDYDEDTTIKILKCGLKNYNGTPEDADLFWEGYYS